MEQHAVAAAANRCSTRRDSPIIPRLQQLHIRLLIRTRNTGSSSPAHIISVTRKAMCRVEQVVNPILQHKTRCFNERSVPVGSVAVKDLYRVSNGSNTVRLNLLEHDGRWDERRNAIVAVSPVANAVAVNFIYDVAGAICVFESCSVDRSALAQGTGERGVAGDERAGRAVCYSGADAVVRCICFRFSGVVHHEFSVVLSNCVSYIVQWVCCRRYMLTRIITSGAQWSLSVSQLEIVGRASMSNSVHVEKSFEVATCIRLPFPFVP